MDKMIRKPYCQGWYPETLDKVKGFISSGKEKTDEKIILGIVPHAGWFYSGKVAGIVYGSISKVDTIIFTATNHTGEGPPSSLFPAGLWQTPFGEIQVDSDFSERLLKTSKTLQTDVQAHIYEHAIEVQLPFLSALYPEAKIVPIEMRDYRIETCREIGHSIAKVIEQMTKKFPNKKYAVIASSDMSHCGKRYGQIPPQNMTPNRFAKEQDQVAIEQILKLNSEKLLKVVKENKITMCGSGPAATVIETAGKLGIQKTKLLDYKTSADVSGEDTDLAVGYAGILIK